MNVQQDPTPSIDADSGRRPAGGPGVDGSQGSGWRLPALVLLAVVAVAAGFFFGRGLFGTSKQSVSTEQTPGAAPSATTAPAGQATGYPQGSKRDMGALGDYVEIGRTPNARTTPSDQGAAMPGISPSEVVTMEPSIHVLRGKPAPDLTMTVLATGETMSLSDLKGRPVLVNFWATWCVPCRIEMPWLQAVRDAHAAEGFEVLAVDAGEKVPPTLAKESVSRYVDSLGLTFPVLYGENTYELQKAWTVIGLPVTFLIGRDGTVVDVHTGGYPNQVTLDAQVKDLIARP